jgi:hypothetical protein
MQRWEELVRCNDSWTEHILHLCRQVVPYAAYAGALCLDGPTLTNLELLESSAGSSEGSLLACLDSCASAGVHLPVMTRVLPCHLLPLSMPWELEAHQLPGA